MLRDLHAGDMIDGKYRVLRTLGKGGMGIVVEALHLRLGTHVAIKLLAAPPKGSSDRSIKALVREAQVAARLRGEHVARVFDVGLLSDGTPFVVMEHLRGVTLHEKIHGDGATPTSTERAVELIMQACDALAEAHALGIVHRDLKPANLYVTQLPNGREVIKVLDFGIAQLLTEAAVGDVNESTRNLGDCPSDRRLLPEGSIFAGTPQYMAPERFEQRPSATREGDIWSLGVIFYEILTRRRPFDSRQLVQLVWQVTSTEPTPIRELRPEVPPGIEAIVRRCLSRDPAARYRSIDDLVRDLEPYRASSATSSGSTPPVVMPAHAPPVVRSGTVAVSAPRPSRAARHGWTIALSLLALLTVVILPRAIKVERARSVTNTAPAPPATERAKTEKPLVTLAGSTTVSELGDHWKSALAAGNSELTLKVEPSSTAAGLGALTRREVDLVGASRPATPEELEIARANGVALEPHVVARDGLAVIVHPENRADALTIEQLRGVLTGKIKTWPSSRNASPIHLLVRPEDQGSSEILKDQVLHAGDSLTDSAEVVRRTEDVVKRVRSDPYAISFVTFRDVGPTKVLKLRPAGASAVIAPSTMTIRSQKYPLHRDLYIYTRSDARPETKDVVMFITEGAGRRVVSESGFVPPRD